MGLKDGAVSVPPTNTPQVLGYYAKGGTPCKPGPSPVPFVLLGHIDGAGKPGVFAKLNTLKPGATVTVGLDNGQHCTYKITRLAAVDKNAAANAKTQAAQTIWGPVPNGQIRLVSCGGKFVGPPLYYQDNIVGIGTLVT